MLAGREALDLRDDVRAAVHFRERDGAGDLAVAQPVEFGGGLDRIFDDERGLGVLHVGAKSECSDGECDDGKGK